MTEVANSTKESGSHILVRARGITKSFGEDDARIHVLKGVDLDVAMGEILLLVGPSGSGKTTLLSVIAGILDLDEGEVTVLGESVPDLSPTAKTDFRSKYFGFIFQEFNLLPTLTAAENTAVPLLIQGVPRKEAIKRAVETLKDLGMGERSHALPARLSGGEKQRVAIGRALVSEPQLLLCDEPTANLDAHTGHKVVEQLQKVGKRPDRAVIIVTHDSRIFEFGDRIVHMDDGQIHQVQEANGGQP